MHGERESGNGRAGSMIREYKRMERWKGKADRMGSRKRAAST